MKNKLPEGWKKLDLGNLFNFEKKSNIKAGEGKEYGKYKFFTSSAVQSKFIDKAVFDGEFLVFSTGGSAGIHYCKEKFSTSTDCFIVKVDSIIITKYVYYYLFANLHILERGFKGAGLKHISKEYIRRIKITYPEKMETQQKIVSILEKTEKLKEYRKNADELTDVFLKTVFYEMFGDERKNTNKFDIKGFLYVFNTATGKLNSNASVENGKYPFFTCSQETFKIDKYSFDCEALLLAGNNATAKYSVKHYNGKFDAYQRTYILTLKNNSELYSFYHYQLEQKLGELQNKSIGTNTKYLTLGILRDIKMICPPFPLQQKFASIVKEVEAMKEQQKHSKEQIDNLFNALMQKAFNGKLIMGD